MRSEAATWPHDAPARAGCKLAQVTANAIAADIVSQRMRVGDFIGRESDIQEWFKTSRSILREALMILENEGLTRMRRGRVGGLVVASTPLAAAVVPTSNYLYFCNLTPRHLLEAWRPVEDYCCLAAVGRATPEQLATVKALLDLVQIAPADDQLMRVRDLRRAMLNAAGNPILQLYEHIYTRVQLDFTVFGGETLQARRLVEGEYVAHRCEQARALLAGDPIEMVMNGHQARELFRPYISAERREDGPLPQGVLDDYSRARAQGALPGFNDTQIKRSTTLAFEIYGSIRGLAAGERVGSEPELLKRFGVARGTLREAIRTLERHGAVVMEAGQSGGLFVGEPNPDAALRSAHAYLQSLDLEPAAAFEAGELLFILAAGLAAERGGADAARALRGHGVTDDDLAQGFYRQARGLGEASGNSLLEFMLRITGHMTTRAPLDAAGARDAAVDGLRGCWGELTDAVEACDRIAARRAAVSYQRLLGQICPGKSHGTPWGWGA